MHQSANSLSPNPNSAVLYVDMNSFFASCEQSDRAELRGKPVGVCAGSKYYAVVIAPSVEAKKLGVKTGMRMNEIRQFCPQIIQVEARPVLYRQVHIQIMEVLRRFCKAEDVLAKSIDEAALNLTGYKLVYKDLIALGREIKLQLSKAIGPYITCSIGIAPNTFLAKLATEIQKPDGLVQLTPENLDAHLEKMRLTDLPGIAARNERRLQMIGIKNPVQMRHTSPTLLRKAFGGVTGDYWHNRLNFGEVDFYTNDYRAMSATRTTSPEHRTPEKLTALLISLCTKLEQRLVKARVFCRQATLFFRYQNLTGWDTSVRFTNPLQDAMELRTYLMSRILEFEQSRRSGPLINSGIKQMGVTIMDFVREDRLQYSLFDNRFKQDLLRKVMYGIKDKYGKYKIRKASEVVERSHMKDAIGFGSVKDLYETEDQEINTFLLEETDE